VRGFLTIGFSTYEMLEISEAEMDKLLSTKGGDSWEWPYRFCAKTKRVWPRLKWDNMEVFFQG
jgi:hypothetical protein